MKFFFHPEADQELNLTVEYYEERQPGLGLEFAEEVYSTIARIREFPDAWTRITSNARRCLVNRFPYGVIYRVESGVLHVVALANLHRRPGYWQSRIQR